MHLDVSVERNIKGHILIMISGSLVATTNAVLEKALTTELNDHNFHFIIDMSNVKYIDSAGFGAIAITIKKLEKKGSLKLIGLNQNLTRIFDITGLTRLINVYPSVAEVPEIK